MIPLTWPMLTSGLGAKPIQGHIYRINILSMGPSDIGPYDELKRYVQTPAYQAMIKTNSVKAVQVHHIVNGEHLHATGWRYEVAPCIVLDSRLHAHYHGRFSSVLPSYHGRLDVGAISDKDRLELYYAMYVEQTNWRELWTIAARIITGKLQPPNPNTFLTL